MRSVHRFSCHVSVSAGGEASQLGEVLGVKSQKEWMTGSGGEGHWGQQVGLRWHRWPGRARRPLAGRGWEELHEAG